MVNAYNYRKPFADWPSPEIRQHAIQQMLVARDHKCYIFMSIVDPTCNHSNPSLQALTGFF